MKVLVTGAHGQLGRSLQANVPAGITMVGVDLEDFDIADEHQVRDRLQLEQPDVVVNTAAWTAVDLAEANEADAVKANVDGPRILAEVSKELGARLIHVSTDFVFDGHADSPYSPTAIANPQSVYGRTKYDGEQAVLTAMPNSAVILRTAWLYSEYGGNFVSTMLRLMSERDEISVVSDQIGTPTWARSVADAIFSFLDQPDVSGIFHWTDSGQASWYDFATAIKEEASDLGILDNAAEILPIPSKDYKVAATRPAYSVLDCSKTENALHISATPWRESLRMMLKAGDKS